MGSTIDGNPVIPPSSDLVVGVDTYVTIEEADAYLASIYVSTDAYLIAWKALSDSDKSIYLRNATMSLEQIRYPGRKYDIDQVLSFPRAQEFVTPHRREPGYYFGPCDDYDPLYHGENVVPDAIKAAQVDEAFELSNPSDDTDYFDNMNGSVKSYKTGDGSETFRAPGSGSSRSNGTDLYLKSKAAQNKAGVFAGGAFSVR